MISSNKKLSFYGFEKNKVLITKSYYLIMLLLSQQPNINNSSCAHSISTSKSWTLTSQNTLHSTIWILFPRFHLIVQHTPFQVLANWIYMQLQCHDFFLFLFSSHIGLHFLVTSYFKVTIHSTKKKPKLNLPFIWFTSYFEMAFLITQCHLW
jgi:hypothetical protein